MGLQVHSCPLEGVNGTACFTACMPSLPGIQETMTNAEAWEPTRAGGMKT